MTITISHPDTQKITVTIPVTLLNRLEERIPKRPRSEFIIEAIEEYLALAEQAAAIEEAAGAWSDENHLDLRTDADIERWLASLRTNWTTQGA